MPGVCLTTPSVAILSENPPPTPEEQRATGERIFDIIEFLRDQVSSGVEEAGYFHSWAGCGGHYRVFDAAPAREFSRDPINVLLGSYGD
jgi:hypothetical protein